MVSKYCQEIKNLCFRLQHESNNPCKKHNIFKITSDECHMCMNKFKYILYCTRIRVYKIKIFEGELVENADVLLLLQKFYE